MRRRTTQSRLNRTSVKQNNRQSLYFIIAFVILIILLIQFGPFFINAFGNIVYSIRGNKDNNTQLVGKEVLQAPNLFNIPEATQSAYINFNGTTTLDKGTVEIYVNGDLEKEIDLNGSSDFEAKLIRLTAGGNVIKARLVSDSQTSPFTEDFNISYLKEKPKLEISSPSNNSTFTRADRKISIAGKTDSENTVTVNSFRAIVDSNGSFSYLLELKDGDNNISIIAVNPAGITNQVDLKVTYQP